MDNATGPNLSYADKLRDPRWQRKRLEILQRDNWTCCCCGDSKKTLHIHHKSYVRGAEPWDYPNANFATLCELCHGEERFRKQYEQELIENLRESGIFAVDVGLLASAFNSKPPVDFSIYKMGVLGFLFCFLLRKLDMQEYLYNYLKEKGIEPDHVQNIRQSWKGNI